jgi:hypothetical protein
MKKIIITLLLCSFIHSISAQNWNPQKTWVFMVGVLEWQDKASLPSFEKKGRIDNLLFNQLKKNGVPASQMIYIQDTQAGTQSIQQKLAEFAAKGGTDDIFFFYYCGHGYKLDKKGVCFASYDCNAQRNWEVSKIVSTIYNNFKGKTIFLTADCCNSGALAQEAKKYSGKTVFALSSVIPTDVSTGNWTFSNALLAAFRGDNFVDTDNNRKITVKEFADFADAEMAVVEKQKSAFYVPASAANYVISSNVTPKSDARIGERVNVKYDGTDWLGRIEAFKDNLYQVRFYSYTNNETDWVKPEKCIRFQPKNFAVGTNVEVLWKDKNYAGKVLQVSNGMHFIKYDGWGDEYNDWITFDKIKKK